MVSIVEKFVNILSTKQVRNKYFYHFTDESNLNSIRNSGLVSRQYANLNKIKIEAFGGNAISKLQDESCGQDKYVHLSFDSDHPLLFYAKHEKRITKPITLRISPKVLFIDGVKISLGVANANNAIILTPEDAIKKLDLKVLYENTDWRDPEVKSRLNAARKCEILIPDLIPREMIIKGL